MSYPKNTAFLSSQTDTLLNKGLSEMFKSLVEGSGYEFLDDCEPLLPNIIGIRSVSRTWDRFDDKMYVVVRDERGHWNIDTYDTTMDPGAFYARVKFANRKGAGIIAPGQYPVFVLEEYKNHGLALCQRRGPVNVYRDNDKDSIMEMDVSTLEQGHGFHIHHVSQSEADYVGRRSAGCTEFRYVSEWERFLELCKKVNYARPGHTFTYTVINDRQI